ncbi:MAG: PSD1 and planctomycete cytochrome C domain-containing protein, partial [Verrucomicrobiales bacterium]|nr:PSD1 and planctomycete cytochrome C domain-containing protein [Verrucomicrobiales bacterium]
MKDGKSIEDLIRIQIERPLRESERERLNDLLRESPEALDTWLDHCEMETWLTASALAVEEPDCTLLNRKSYPVQSGIVQGTTLRKRWFAACAAILVVGFLVVFLPDHDEPTVTGAEPSSDSSGPEDSRQVEYEKIVANLPVVASQTRPPTSFENVSLTTGSEEVNFNNDIRPILTENCIACHGPDEHGRKAKLRLDTYEGATTGESPAIVPGDADASELIARIQSDDVDDIMPPPDSHKTLTDGQKNLLRKWIDQGAEYTEHWAFVAPEKPPIPESVEHPVDFLVEKNLRKNNLSLSPRADKNMLLRRVCFDLTGLPPSPQMIEDFISDTSSDAYEKLIDKLLSSEAYGEHRARYWLDAARYGDTHGLHLDNYREIWPYRDWVIDAYNINMPFDQFTIEQIAGDLLPNPTQSQLIATGFNRCNVTTSEGGAIDEEFHVRYGVDRVSTTATVWMGMTAGCAQCHDHKFDPLTMKEFYELFAFFNNTTQAAMDGNIKDSPPVIHVYGDESKKSEVAELSKRIRELQGEWSRAKKSEKPALEAWIKSVTPASMDGFSLPGQFTTSPLKNESSESVVINDLPNPGKNDRFSISFRHVMPVSGPSVLFDNTDPDNQNRGIRIRVIDDRINVELIEAWPNRVIRTGAARAFKPGSHGHFAVTYDGSGSSKGIRMFSNGKWLNSRYAASWVDTLENDFATDSPAKIGGADSETGLFPQISEFHFFTEVLPEETIASLAMYSAGKLAARKLEEKRKKSEVDALTGFFHNVISSKTVATLTALEEARIQLRELQADAPTTLVMHEKDGPAKAHILDRGEYDLKLDEVTAGFPRFIQMNGEFSKDRLGLAKWLVDSRHPLTARVTVNRIWQELFGRGIVKTSEDFGTQGENPSNRELLDYLATYFMDNGWDVKGLYRHILLSKVYQQTSRGTPEKVAKDPGNILLARGARFRLDAEMIRDQALFASGLLDDSVGGPSVKPYQPAGLWKTVGYTNSNTQTFLQDYGAEPEHRRSLYSFWKRTSPPPNMSIFDAPDRESCTVRRERTNTPLQALVLMNDPQFVRAARFLALRTLKEAQKPDDQRVRYLSLLMLGRELLEDEIRLVKNSLTQFRDIYTSNSEAARDLLSDEVNPLFTIRNDEYESRDIA